MLIVTHCAISFERVPVSLACFSEALFALMVFNLIIATLGNFLANGLIYRLVELGTVNLVAVLVHRLLS